MTNENEVEGGKAWLALVIALPAITVLAGFVTLYIAFKYADEEITPDINRFGVNIHEEVIQHEK